MILHNELKSPVDEMQNLLEKIDKITEHQKPYIGKSLKRMAEKSADNVKVICEYIIAEQNAINIKVLPICSLYSNTCAKCSQY